MTTNAERMEFRRRLKEELSARGIELVTAELGRLVGGGPVWIVTVKGPDGLETYRTEFDRDTESYGSFALAELVFRLDHQVLRPLKEGGPWLGAARNYLKWHVPGGDICTWGSGDALTLSVRQIEELAEAAVTADRADRKD